MLGLSRAESSMQDAILEKLILKTSNCIDVGVHIGSFTHTIFRHAPDGSHTVIEPVSYKANWLRKRFPSAVVHQCAVSDIVGEISFYENTDNPGFSSITARGGLEKQKETRVLCSTLDTLVPSGKKIDFIKIDVEGHEWDVVRGANRLIGNFRPIVMFEAGALHDADMDEQKYVKLFAYWTEQENYDVFAVMDLKFGRPPLSLNAFQLYRTYPFLSFNFIAMPRA